MIEETRVVNVRKEGHDVYIGRGSMWGNPFRIGPDGNRVEVIKKFERWFKTNYDLQKNLYELKGKRLGCHCHPHLCHGEVLKKWVDKLKEDE